jgi:hypothetical protein
MTSDDCTEFVEQQKFGAGREDHAELEPFAVAEGEGVRGGACHGIESEIVEHLHRRFGKIGERRFRQRERPSGRWQQRRPHIVEHGQPAEDAADLKRPSDAEARDLLRQSA